MFFLLPTAYISQMLSATSFQMTLLTGQSFQSNNQLYILGAIVFAGTALWYPLFRMKPSIHVLSLPWMFFGLAFFLVGLPSVANPLHSSRTILFSAASYCYGIASAASFAFFGLNFGEEAVSSYF